MHFSPKKESHSLKKHCNYCQKKRLKMFNGGQVAPRTSIHCPVVGSFWDSNKMSLGVVQNGVETYIYHHVNYSISFRSLEPTWCFSLFSLQPVAFPLPNGLSWLSFLHLAFFLGLESPLKNDAWKTLFSS